MLPLLKKATGSAARTVWAGQPVLVTLWLILQREEAGGRFGETVLMYCRSVKVVKEA